MEELTIEDLRNAQEFLKKASRIDYSQQLVGTKYGVVRIKDGKIIEGSKKAINWLKNTLINKQPK